MLYLTFLITLGALKVIGMQDGGGLDPRIPKNFGSVVDSFGNMVLGVGASLGGLDYKDMILVVIYLSCTANFIL